MQDAREANSACQQAWLHFAQGNFASADCVFESALHTQFSLVTLTNWARSLRYRGRFCDAVSLLKQGWNHVRSTRAPCAETLFCLDLAACHRLQEDFTGHQQFLQLAWRSHFDHLDNDAATSDSALNDAEEISLSQLFLEQSFACIHSGDIYEARDWLKRCEETSDVNGANAPERLRLHASLEWQAGFGESALSLLQACCHESRKLGDFHSNILYSKQGALWALQLENQREGIRFLKNAMDSANRIQDQKSVRELQSWISRLTRAQVLLSASAELN